MRLPIAKRFCPKPFEFLEVTVDGSAWVCCEDWLPIPIGNVVNGVESAWNSEVAQAIRSSILDGSFRYCNASTCPAIVQRTLPVVAEIQDSLLLDALINNTTKLVSGPRTLALSYDFSCNLKCPTCRSEFLQLKGEGVVQARRIHDEIVGTYLPTARDVIITGAGDALSSPLFGGFLKTIRASDYPGLRICVMTNGLLLTEELWSELKDAHPIIDGVTVSIDAATSGTYQVNRGGSWSKLLKNLLFLGSLVRDKKLTYFEMSFVVQSNNYLEMEAFVQLARSVGAGSVLFQKVLPWEGTDFSDPERYAAIAIHDPAHPDHTDFLRVISARLFGDADIDLSNLADYRDAHS